jgi:hypothetical protein
MVWLSNCHLYPHFAQGMWALWRVHDVLEDGTRLLPDGQAPLRPRAGLLLRQVALLAAVVDPVGEALLRPDGLATATARPATRSSTATSTRTSRRGCGRSGASTTCWRTAPAPASCCGR